MSAVYPVRKTAPVRKATTKSRPRLVVVSTKRNRVVARGPFLALVGLLMLGGLLSLLMLHTLAAQDAFQQTSLQQRLNTLTDTEQQLEQQVQTDAGPASLEARAKALGMVPSTLTSYRQRANGRTVAREVPATASATTADTNANADSTTDSNADSNAGTNPNTAPTDAGKPSTDQTSTAKHGKRDAPSKSAKGKTSKGGTSH